MKLVLAAAMVAFVGLAGCGQNADDTPDQASAPVEADVPNPAPAAVAQPSPAAFDLSKVPVSTAQLGDFPHLATPAGYTVNDDSTMDLAAFPIWTGDDFQVVEGKVYMARSGTPEGKTYSRIEFERGIENAVKAAGGVRVTKSGAPSDVIERLPESLRQDMGLGLGPIYGNDLTSYVIRRADRVIWVQAVSDQNQTAWAIVDAPLS